MGNGTKQVVNTDGISFALTKLRTVNNNINNSFHSMERKSKRLECNWNSAAGSRACTMMYQLFGGNETRSSVIQNYVNMLEQQVTPGYVSTEDTNTSIADMFK